MANGLHLSDFCLIDGSTEDCRFSQFERLTLVGGKELERALDWVSKQIGKFSASDQVGAVSAESILNALKLYGDPALIQSPELFFRPLDTLPSVEQIPIHGFKDGEIIDLRFKSVYRAFNRSFEEELARAEQNNQVHARWWRHSEPARATMVAIHGWNMGDQKISALALQPGYFYSLGLDVVVIELPYHGRRAGAQTSNSGPIFPDSNFVRTNEGMGQVISDLRVLRSFLKDNGTEQVGVMGMSLGGYASALWASLDKLAFCVTIVPMACMADVAYGVLSRNPVLKPLSDSILTLDNLKRIYHLHSPLNHRPKLPVGSRFIVAGLGDEIVSPTHPHRLWEHWDRPEIHWFAGGHVAQFKDSKAFKEIGKFLTGLGVTK